MTVFDLVGDLLGRNRPESPQNRPESPARRPAETQVWRGFSPKSPQSPHLPLSPAKLPCVWIFTIDGKRIAAIDAERRSRDQMLADLRVKFGDRVADLMRVERG